MHRSRREPCENRWTDRDAVWVEDFGGTKESSVRWGPDPPWERAFWEERAVHCKDKYRHALPCAVQNGWTDRHIPFGIWTRVGPNNCILGGSAHWHYLANTIELSMCGGDVACCQLTLITWFIESKRWTYQQRCPWQSYSNSYMLRKYLKFLSTFYLLQKNIPS